MFAEFNTSAAAVSRSPVRIARIVTRLNIGGPSIQAIGLSRDLSTHGFATCLLHGRRSDNEGYMGDLLSIRAERIEYVPSLVRRISPFHDVRALWVLTRTLWQWRPRVVHTHMAKAGTIGRLAALLYNSLTRGPKAKLIHTYHGHVFEGYFGRRTTKIFLAIERWLAKHTDSIVAISPRVRDDVIATFKIAAAPQVTIIPLGFDLTPFLTITGEHRARARAELSVPDGAIVITTVGRLTAIKAQSLFLRAAALLMGTSRFQFIIVGDGELRQQLESEAKTLGLAHATRFLGWRGDLQNIYAATDVFVLTSRNEGTPVALIEAMAASTACVSTDVGGVRDVVASPDQGILVPFDDVRALARAIQVLVDDEGARTAMGERARVSVRTRYDHRRLVDDISNLYWRLLADDGTIASPLAAE